MATDFAAVVMAAGLGTRMKSATPKHLHPLLGRRLVDWVVAAVRPLGPDPLVVVLSPEAAGALDGVDGRRAGTSARNRRLAPRARESVGDARTLLVVSGDHPRISPGLLAAIRRRAPLLRRAGHRALVRAARSARLRPDRPRRRRPSAGDRRGCRRRRRAAGDSERSTPPSTSSRLTKLWPVLERIEPANAQGELYLTDAVRLLVEGGEEVVVFKAPDADEVEGVNTRAELADAAAFLRARVNREHMLAGVTIVDPQTTWIDPEVELERRLDHSPVHGASRAHPSRQPAPRSGRTSSPTTRRSGQTPRSARSVTSARARSSARARRQARSSRSRTPRSAPGAKMPHLSYIGDAEVGRGR